MNKHLITAFIHSYHYKKSYNCLLISVSFKFYKMFLCIHRECFLEYILWQANLGKTDIFDKMYGKTWTSVGIKSDTLEFFSWMVLQMASKLIWFKLMPILFFLCEITKNYYITVTSKWARWRLKTPASWLFTQAFVQAQIKKAPRHWPLWEEFTDHRWIPRTMGQ